MKNRNKPTRMTSLEESKNKTLKLILIAILGILLVSLLTSIIVERSNTETIISYIMQILSRYTLNISNEISAPIKKIGTEVSIIQNMQKHVSGEKIRDELYYLAVNNSDIIKNITIVTRKDDGSWVCLSSISTNDTRLLEHFSEFIRAVPETITAEFFPIVIMLSPYEETMGHCIILPFLVYSKRNDTFAIFEVNITLMLKNMNNAQENNLLKNDLQVLINIYDKDGLLLETSRNFNRKTINTFQKDGIFSKFNSYNSNLGLFTFSTKNTIWMMHQDSDIGLSVAVCIPAEFIAKNTTNIRVAILSIAILSSIAILFTLLVTFKTTKNYQLLAAMQAEIRFKALQSKMAPHLIFNTLDSMVCTIEEGDNASALACIRALAYMLQVDLRDNNTEISMSKQVRYLKSYVNLQEIRYRDKFDFNLDIDVGDYSLDSLRILKFCVEPLVENCFVHSVYQGQPFTHISVSYKVVNSKLVIIVANDSVLLSEKQQNELKALLEDRKKLDTSHIGLLSINERIRLLYGKDYGIDIIPERRRFSVRVRLPILTE